MLILFSSSLPSSHYCKLSKANFTINLLIAVAKGELPLSSTLQPFTALLAMMELDPIHVSPLSAGMDAGGGFAPASCVPFHILAPWSSVGVQNTQWYSPQQVLVGTPMSILPGKFYHCPELAYGDAVAPLCTASCLSALVYSSTLAQIFTIQ